MTINRPAALAICGMATDTDDARTLLAMLGIYPEGREVSAHSLAIFHPKTNRSAAKPPAPVTKTERVYDYQPCGTPAAYRRHLRADETPCPACRNAATLDRQLRKEKKPS